MNAMTQNENQTQNNAGIPLGNDFERALADLLYGVTGKFVITPDDDATSIIKMIDDAYSQHMSEYDDLAIRLDEVEEDLYYREDDLTSVIEELETTIEELQDEITNLMEDSTEE